MREGLLVDLACELGSHVSLWQLGLVYADAGGPLTQALLERVPLRSEHKAEKVIQAAAERGLDHVGALRSVSFGGRRSPFGRDSMLVWVPGPGILRSGFIPGQSDPCFRTRN